MQTNQPFTDDQNVIRDASHVAVSQPVENEDETVLMGGAQRKRVNNVKTGNLSREEWVLRQKKAFVMSMISGQAMDASMVDDEQYRDCIDLENIERRKAGLSFFDKFVKLISGWDKSSHFLCALVLGGAFPFVAVDMWKHPSAMNSEGGILEVVFVVLTILALPAILFWKEGDNKKIIKVGLIALALSIANFLLLGIWNSSLVDAFAVLSVCLAFLSACFVLKIKN